MKKYNRIMLGKSGCYADQCKSEGRIYKLSPFTAAFLPDEMRNASDAYQGPKYFSYKGKALDDLRKELEDCY